MIGFFPIPFPDEILYSVFARYHARARNKFLAATTKTLFGHEAARISIELPNKLGYLISQLPLNSPLTVDRLIYQNTLFPFYAPFLPPDRIQKLKEDMTGKSSGGTIHGRLGVQTSNIAVDFLRFCPVCVETDTELYGEPYWHRIHQLPGIFVCPHHSVFLKDSKVKSSYHSRKDTLVRAKTAIVKSAVEYLCSSNENHKSHLYLAKQSFWLLNQMNLENCGPDFFRKKFLHFLILKGWTSIKGVTQISNLENEFNKFYNSEFLAVLSSGLNQKYTWLRRLLQSSHHIQHPIRNLLFTNFFGISIQEIIGMEDFEHPIQGKSFPCLNPFADHFNELIVKTVKYNHRIKDKNGISAAFSCECGFSYRRHNLEKKNELMSLPPVIVSYGDTFFKKLRNFCGNNYTRKNIAKEFNVPLTTVTRWFAAFHIYKNKPPLSRVKKSSRSSKVEKRRQNYRAIWKELQLLNPEASRTQLKMLNNTVGHWIAVYDTQWYTENSPSKKISRKKDFRIDWKSKDFDFSQKVEILALEMLNSKEKPVRVTITGLSKRLGFHYLINKRPECIPNTIEILKKYAESTEEFIVRRVQFAANKIVKDNITASYTDLIIKSGLMKPHLIQLPKVQEALKRALIHIKENDYGGFANE
jgi:hypothetical protein